jgi:hypothetical protein
MSSVGINVKTSDASVDAMLHSMAEVLSGMLLQKVSNVTLSLGADGLFDVVWTETGSDQPTGMPQFVKQLVSIHYYLADGKLYLALDKAAVPLLAAIPLPEGIDLYATISALAEDRGGFLVLPIGVAEMQPDGSAPLTTSFYVGKETVRLLLPLFTPMLTSDLPIGAEMLQLIRKLPDIVAEAELFEVSLNFGKSN